ncbi:MAG: hypothetical protein ACK44W_06470 [Planctomycetota bacterium]
MARRGAGAALTAGLLLAACRGAGAPAEARPSAAGGLEVAAELESSGPRPREGDLATVVFRLRNAGPNLVVLRDLTCLADPKLGEAASAVATWQFSLPGHLEYRPRTDEWIYDRSRPAPEGRRPLVFNSGLLVPGESLTVRARLRMLGLPRLFHVLYFELPAAEAWNRIYWEDRSGREVRYRTLVGQQLERRLTPSADPDRPGHRRVIFPHAEALVLPNALLKVVRIDADLEPRPFGLSQAARQVGGPPDAYTYSTFLDGWILRRAERFWWVNPSGAVPLPEIRPMDRVFHILDDTGRGRLQIELRGDSIASTFQREKGYTLVSQTRDGRTRYYAFLAPEEVPRFLEDVRSLGLVLGAEIAPEGSVLRVQHRD